MAEVSPDGATQTWAVNNAGQVTEATDAEDNSTFYSYATNGDLKATPNIGGVDRHHREGFKNSDHGLKPVRSAVFMGILFVNLSGDAPDFAVHAGQLVRRAEQFLGTDGWSQLKPGVTDSRLSLTAQCNWKLAVENYCEAYHLPSVHPELNASDSGEETDEA